LWNTQVESEASCTVTITCADGSTQTEAFDWVPEMQAGCFRAEPAEVFLCTGVTLDGSAD